MISKSRVLVCKEVPFKSEPGIGRLPIVRPGGKVLVGSPTPRKPVEGRVVISWDYVGEDGTLRFSACGRDFELAHRRGGYGRDEIVAELNRQGAGAVLWRWDEGDPSLLLCRRADAGERR